MNIQTIPYKNGQCLAYAEYGDPNGFAVLVQHGMIASINDGTLFQRLSDSGARVICAARPGYGASSPYVLNNIGEWGEIVAALVGELRLRRFDILGISSGAPYSYAIARKFPGQVRNLYILSGIPALYDKYVLARWPYSLNPHATLNEMEQLAHELYFVNLSREDRKQSALRDSQMNHGFGIAQDLKIRSKDWGFRLTEVQAKVYMRHSRADNSVPLITAEMTARLLPNCELEIRENDAHFSPEVLDDFIATVMLGKDA